MKPTHRFFYFNASPILVTATLFAVFCCTPLFAQASGEGDSRSLRGVAQPDGSDAPLSRQKNIPVMVEFLQAPAAKDYSEALRTAQAQVDAQRNYALAHPNLRSSKLLLSKPAVATTIGATAARQVAARVRDLDNFQKAILPNLTSKDIGGRVMFRSTRAYNGIAMVVPADKIAQIAALPGVKAVHPMHPKFRTSAFSDVDFLGARAFWTKPPFGVHGENIRVADIDSGLDYIHANFGGPGPSGYALVPDHGSATSAPNPFFPTQKVPGGYDFAGDNYDANFSDPAHAPAPDPDPFDCGGHGSGTASLIAGYGVTSAGFTYAGSYDATNPAMSNLSISPGMAPAAKLYPLRVFGCSGSTLLVIQAIEWAMDPNGDGNFNDHLDVINMSLGSNEGWADDPDDIAASNAAAIGVLVCSAAGNAGDTFYVHSSPAAAPGTLSVGATYSDQNGFIFDSSVTANSPAAIAGQKYPSLYGSPAVHTAGLTGDVVYAVPNDAATDGANGGSTPLTNAAQISGKIALINRGTSSFIDKCKKAQAAGAIGVIVNNFNNPTADPIVMALDSTITIPCVMISRASRDAIVAASGGFDAVTGLPVNTVNVTIKNDN